MLFSLPYFPDAGACRIHNSFGFFLREAVKAEKFGQDLFPEWFRPVVENSPGLEKKFKELHKQIKTRNKRTRTLLVATLDNHESIEDLCQDPNVVVLKTKALPRKLRIAVEEVTDCLFEETLKKSKTAQDQLGLQVNCLSDHYQNFRAQVMICPFCGLESYPASLGEGRSAYDHYMSRAQYPLVAASMKNLVPMCDRCNGARNKGNKDVLHEDNGQRRCAYYPYARCSGIELRAMCTGQGTVDMLSDWEITVIPADPDENEEVTTWMDIFRIKERYEGRLAQDAQHWIKSDLAGAAELEPGLQIRELRDFLGRLATRYCREAKTRVNPSSHLKQALYEYLANEAEDPVIEGYRSLIGQPYFKQLESRAESITQ